MKRLKKVFFRWHQLLILLSYSLPLMLTCVLGLLWLYQNGWLVQFFIFCLVLSLIAFGVRRGAKKTTLSASGTPNIDSDVSPNPEWAQRETEAFNSSCAFIHEQTQSVLPWQEMPELALEVIHKVALGIGGDRKKPLDFSAPEGFLLIEQTASRYRQHLRHHLPFADQISIANMVWVWKKRKNLSMAWKLADGGRRLARFASNPAGAAVKEIEQLVTGGNASYLSDQMMMTLQTVFLEEVASVAVDLYSGRLKFTDAELQGVTLESLQRDQERVAPTDDPVRILVVGQVSSGKSSLLNHLLDHDAAETDTAATTDKVVNYLAELNETPCHFLDSPGIDGIEENMEMLLEEICDSDMVLWTLRADRPSRAADAALLARIRQWEDTHPLRRRPEIIFVVTFVDRIVETWPMPEHELSTGVQSTFAQLTAAISSDLVIEAPVLVSNSPEAWNLSVLAAEIEHRLPKALMSQRNRKRLSAHKDSSSLRRAAKRGLRGLYRSGKYLGARWITAKQQQRKGSPK